MHSAFGRESYPHISNLSSHLLLIVNNRTNSLITLIREDQLAREFGKRRAAHDRTSQCRGHDYQHSPPLYSGGADEESGTTRRKSRRSKEQIEREEAEKKAEQERLKALFDGGDVTFTTLGVIDVNLGVTGKGRKKKRKEGGQENVGEGDSKRDPPPTPRIRSDGRVSSQHVS